MVLNHTRVLFQIGEGYAAIQRGGGRPVVGDRGSLMTYSAGSETGFPLQINRTKHQRSEHQRATDQLLYRSTKTG